METAGCTSSPHIALRYRAAGNLVMSVAAKEWSFIFSLGLPERNPDSNASTFFVHAFGCYNNSRSRLWRLFVVFSIQGLQARFFQIQLQL